MFIVGFDSISVPHECPALTCKSFKEALVAYRALATLSVAGGDQTFLVSNPGPVSRSAL